MFFPSSYNPIFNPFIEAFRLGLPVSSICIAVPAAQVVDTPTVGYDGPHQHAQFDDAHQAVNTYHTGSRAALKET